MTETLNVREIKKKISTGIGVIPDSYRNIFSTVVPTFWASCSSVISSVALISLILLSTEAFSLKPFNFTIKVTW